MLRYMFSCYVFFDTEPFGTDPPPTSEATARRQPACEQPRQPASRQPARKPPAPAIGLGQPGCQPASFQNKKQELESPELEICPKIFLYSLKIMSRVSFSSGRDCACRHCWISSFWTPRENGYYIKKYKTLETISE